MRFLGARLLCGNISRFGVSDAVSSEKKSAIETRNKVRRKGGRLLDVLGLFL